MSVFSRFFPAFCVLVVISATSFQTTCGEEVQAEQAAYEPTTTLDPKIPVEQLRVLVKPLTKAELEIESDAWFELLRRKAKQIAAAQLGVKKTNEALASKDSEEAQAVLDEAAAVEQKATQEAEQAEVELAKKAKQNLGVEESGETPTPDNDVAAETPRDTNGNVAEVASEKKEDLLGSINELQDERTMLADRLEIVLTSLEEKGGEVEQYRDYMRAVAGIDLDANDASATLAAITGWLSSKEGGQRWAWNLGKFLLILLVSYLAAKLIASITNWLLERKIRMSQLAEKLISRTIKNIVMLIGFAIALTALQVDITPILAAIGAAGFIIGFALQGTLSNFASGLMILVNRPFDEGDVVTAGGVTGLIHEMNLVSTTFRTFDNQTIHVPNNEIWGNVITNITANDQRRVDMEFGIGYDDDFEQAEQIIREVVEQHELVLDDPEPQVMLHELGDSSVNIVCRPWSKTSDWWTVKTDVTRRVKQRFDEAGITIPYPQTDIHVYQHDKAVAS